MGVPPSYSLSSLAIATRFPFPSVQVLTHSLSFLAFSESTFGCFLAFFLLLAPLLRLQHIKQFLVVCGTGRCPLKSLALDCGVELRSVWSCFEHLALRPLCEKGEQEDGFPGAVWRFTLEKSVLPTAASVFTLSLPILSSRGSLLPWLGNS